jgi:hypothetical protein
VIATVDLLHQVNTVANDDRKLDLEIADLDHGVLIATHKP